MAPCFDVYVRLREVDRAVVEGFLERHLPGWRDGGAWLSEDGDRVVEAGLRGLAGGQVLYGPVRGSELEFVVLAFPVDGGVVVGVSVDLGVDQDAAAVVAEGWLARMVAELGACEGFFQGEEPPPLSDGEWQEAVGRAFRSRIAQGCG